MKITLHLLIIIVSFAEVSCGTLKYNKVYSYEDEFRDNVKTYTRIRIKPEERKIEIGSARLIIEKEAGDEGEATNAYFVIYRSSSSFKVDRSGFVKIGDKKYEVNLKDPVSELKTKSEVSISGIATADTSGVVTGQTANIDTRTWIEDKFVINFSKEVTAGITASSDIIFRFYFGPIPATYRLEGRSLEAVKRILEYK